MRSVFSASLALIFFPSLLIFDFLPVPSPPSSPHSLEILLFPLLSCPLGTRVHFISFTSIPLPHNSFLTLSPSLSDLAHSLITPLPLSPPFQHFPPLLLLKLDYKLSIALQALNRHKSLDGLKNPISLS